MPDTRSPKRQVDAADESLVSDIQIGTDGRVHVFGASREVLEALDTVGVRGDAIRQRLAQGPSEPHDLPAFRTP